MALEKIEIQNRLSTEAYEQLVKKCHPPFVAKDTSDLQAGFMLGQQYVLQLVRDGFTVG